MCRRLATVLCSASIVVVTAAAPAEEHWDCKGEQEHGACEPARGDYCDSFKRREATISFSAELALSEVAEATLQEGLDDPQRARDGIFAAKDPPLENDEMKLIVRRMEVEYCVLIYSQPDQSGERKRVRYDEVTEAIWQPVSFRPLATTVRREAARPSRRSRPGLSRGVIVRASWSSSSAPAVLLAQDEPSAEPEPDLLAEPPLFVNDTNRCFVIVASVPAQGDVESGWNTEAGIRRMEELKSQAPQYDYALYAPYGGNTNFGIMMASWVSMDVAKKAVKLARRDVEPTSFIWCFPRTVAR